MIDRALADCLTRWGLTPDPAATAPAASKNRVLICADARGDRLLVKASTFSGDRGIFIEGAVLAALHEHCPECREHLPALGHFDAERGVLAVGFVDGAESAHAYHRRRGLPDVAFATEIGRALRQLHDGSRRAPEHFSRLAISPAASDFAARFLRPTPALYASSTAQTLRLIGAVQVEPGALEALDALTWTAPAPCLVHGDLRQSNLLRAQDGAPIFIDWEMACWGEPARDLGSLMGELVLEALDPGLPGSEARTHASSAFVRALRDAYGPMQPTFWLRTLSFAGEALLRASYALTHQQGRFDDFVEQLARWGVELLVRPEAHAAVMLGELS